MSRIWEKYSWIMQNTLKSNEWRKILDPKTFKIEIQKRGPNNSDFLQNWFHAENRSPLFNLWKFQDSEKNTSESCRMHWNPINDDEFGSRKLLKLKYSKRDEKIQTFREIGSPQKFSPPSLICRNFKVLREVLLNHAERLEI